MSSERRTIFTDNEGKPSMMRVKAFICVVAAVALSLYQGTVGDGIDHIIVVELLSAGIGGKLWQKHEENRKTNRNEKST